MPEIVEEILEHSEEVWISPEGEILMESEAVAAGVRVTKLKPQRWY